MKLYLDNLIALRYGKFESGKQNALDFSLDVNGRTEASDITLTLDAVKPVYKSEGSNYPDADHRLAILYELPLKFGSEIQLDVLLGIIVQSLVEVVSGSARAALLLIDPATNTLLLKAHLPPGKPCVSMTLARRALNEQVAFVWQRQDKNELSATRALNDVDCAMYAPLLWRGNALGVICVDNYGRARIFDNDDLKASRRDCSTCGHGGRQSIATGTAASGVSDESESPQTVLP
jgi:hypothetical protein